MPDAELHLQSLGLLTNSSGRTAGPSPGSLLVAHLTLEHIRSGVSHHIDGQSGVCPGRQQRWLRESCAGDGGQAGGWNSVVISTDDKVLEILTRVTFPSDGFICALFGYVDLGMAQVGSFHLNGVVWDRSVR